MVKGVILYAEGLFFTDAGLFCFNPWPKAR